MQETVEKDAMTFTDIMRGRLKGILDPIGRFFNRLGILPNTMTLVGLIGNTIGAYVLSQGEMMWGGLVILAMGPFDALDGTMARLRGEPSEWGAFVDSVVDRYSELITFGGLLYYFLMENNLPAVGWLYGAATGSVLVSYVRARAQSLGVDTKIGLLSRMERYMVLVPTLVLNIPVIGLAIIAVGAHLTALQRIWAMRRQVKK